MFVHLFVAATLMAAGLILFGHFERPSFSLVWRRLSKLVLVLGITALVYHFAGPLWSWLWVVGSVATGVGVHIWLMHRHGINFLTAEPRDKYFALRGWQP